MAQALHEYERDICPGCGHPMSETTDPALEDDWHAGLPVRCFSCTENEKQVKVYKDAPHPAALRFFTQRRSSLLAEQIERDQQAQAWFSQPLD